MNTLETENLADFQNLISEKFEHSLTEEQRFLLGISTGSIKTYSHEEVMADLRKILKQ